MEGLLEQFSGLKSGIAETREEIFTTLDFTLSSLESARDQIRGSKLSVPDPTEDDVKLSTVSAVTTLVKKLESAKPTQKVVDTNVEYYKHISKFGKSIGKYMNPSIEDTSYQVTFKPELVNQAIVDHLYKNGLVEAAEKLAAESKVMVDAENRKKYEELGEIRHELIHKKLEKVMTWVRENSAALLKMNSDTPFTVHKLQFILLAKEGRLKECIEYAHKYFTPFRVNPKYLVETDHLLASILFLKNLESSPYKDLYSESQWNYHVANIVQDYCMLNGFSAKTELSQAVKAGTIALPQILKAASIMKGQGEWPPKKELPVEIELGNEFKYHSIFICPVSKEVSTKANPPMALPCGHVISKNSLERICNAPARGKVKCPTCPQEITMSSGKEIKL